MRFYQFLNTIQCFCQNQIKRYFELYLYVSRTSKHPRITFYCMIQFSGWVISGLQFIRKLKTSNVEKLRTAKLKKSQPAENTSKRAWCPGNKVESSTELNPLMTAQEKGNSRRSCVCMWCSII